MPTKLTCQNCDFTFKEWETSPREDMHSTTADWYYDIYSEFNGHCPKCGKKMPSPLRYAQEMKVEVKPA